VSTDNIVTNPAPVALRLICIGPGDGGDCPRCGVRPASMWSYVGTHGSLDVCRACVREAHDDLVAELQEADSL